MKKITTLICLIVLINAISWAQETFDVRTMTRKQMRTLTYDQLLELSLEDLIYVSDRMGVSIDDLLEDPTTVSSKTQLNSRETPGIVSVVTASDIEKSGAQDLGDILRAIPGIYFGTDVDGVSGIFMRGNWGHEGKILFLLDDMELNENMYSVTQVLNHIPASQISRVEVVRGPGSALYGGYAELGVVKITTHRGDDMHGTDVSVTAGTFGDKLNRNSFGFTTGGQHNHSTYSIMAAWNTMDAGKGNFVDFDGEEYGMQEGWLNSKNAFINMKYSWKQLETQFVYDDFAIVPTGYSAQNNNRFRNYLSQARYNFNPYNNLRVSPGIFFKNQTPYWFENSDEQNFWFYKRIASQINGSLDLEWLATQNLQVISGMGFKYDHARISKEEQEIVGEYFYNEKFTLNHQTIYGYLQAGYTTAIGRFFAGSRIENHSITGTNLAPRLGYTGVFNRINLKYLYSHAFRSPSIENVNINPDILLEKTIVNELALGYKLRDNYYTSVNLYDIKIKDPILYSYDYETGEEIYFNDLQTGSNGIEFEFKAMYSRWNAGLSYSFYDASNRNKSEVYRVRIPSGQLAQMMKGVPSHMVHFNASMRIFTDFWVSPAFSWYSEKYGYISTSEIQDKADPYLIADINLMKRNVFVSNLNLGLSFRNIFNASYGYIQPMGVAGVSERPLPGRPFEALLSLTYQINH